MIVMRTERKQLCVWSTVNWWEEGYVEQARDLIVKRVKMLLKNNEDTLMRLCSNTPSAKWHEQHKMWLLSWDVDITMITEEEMS